jgi:hypothetical protein
MGVKNFHLISLASSRCAMAIGLATAGLILAGCAHPSGPRAAAGSPADLPPETPPRFAPGMVGRFGDRMFAVTAVGQVEVNNGKHTWTRHEYDLLAGDGLRALLLNGLNGDVREWHLMVPPQLPPVFSPDDAATKRPGDEVVADLIPTRITETWQSRTLALAGNSVLLDSSGNWLKGFTTHGTNEWMLIRWHEFRMWIHIGRTVPEAEVFKAFEMPADE